MKVQLATLLLKVLLSGMFLICFLCLWEERFKYRCFHLGLNFRIKKERKHVLLVTQGMSGATALNAVQSLLLICWYQSPLSSSCFSFLYNMIVSALLFCSGNKQTSTQILIIFTHSSINQRNDCLLYFHKSDLTSSI